eukprot:Lithocolla_globosa_v1_NODE_2915_length_1825_cov_6.709605.p1 type:complete len:488 gc:universal NODE_2915_length_1825_cov_6.709605:111-1574(+)
MVKFIKLAFFFSMVVGNWLDDYVHSPSPVFSWEIHSSTQHEGYQLHILRMTSLTWLTESESDNPLWQHWLHIAEPDVLDCARPSMAFQKYDFGDNHDGPTDNPLPSGSRIEDVALDTGCIASLLRQVPNQPICFPEPLPGTGDPNGGCLSEDVLVAYTIEMSYYTLNYEWNIHFPMAKAAKLANDVVVEFARLQIGLNITEFTVYGMSKRGGLSLVMAGVDPRVVGVAVSVYDNAVMECTANLGYQLDGPNWNMGMYDRLKGWTHTEEGLAIGLVDDPAAYFSRITNVQKIFLLAGTDLYFKNDANQCYWSVLPGHKQLRYLPMLHYDVYGSHAVEVIDSMLVWAKSTVLDVDQSIPYPTFTWYPNLLFGGLTVSVRPKDVERLVGVYYYVGNVQNRGTTIPIQAWTRLPADELDAWTFHADVGLPSSGYRFFYMELEFETPFDSERPFQRTTILTTNMYVVPDEMPYGPCPPEVCACGSPVDCGTA